MLCVNTHYPPDPSWAKRPPRSVFPTNFGGSQRPPLEIVSSTRFRAKTLQHDFSTHFRALSSATFPKCSLVSSQDTHQIVVFFSRLLGRLHFPEGFCFLGLLWLLKPPLTALLISLYASFHFPQFFPSMPLHNAWQKVYQSASTKGGPRLSYAMWSTLMHDFQVPTSSALSVNSSGLSLTGTSGNPSSPFGLRTF